MNTPAQQGMTGRLERQEIRISRIGRPKQILGSRSAAITRLRMGTFLAGTLISGLLFREAGPAAGWLGLLATVLLFSAIVFLHRRLKRKERRCRRALSRLETQKARMQRRWDLLPEEEIEKPDRDHPFQADLELTGTRSLHRLMDSCLSDGGSERLKSWLCDSHPSLQTIQRRQRLVRELKELSVFRQRLSLVEGPGGGPRRTKWNSSDLGQWLRKPFPEEPLRRALTLAISLAGLTLALLWLEEFYSWPSLWPLSWFAYLAVLFLKQPLVAELFGEGLSLEVSLKNFTRLMDLVESTGFRAESSVAKFLAPIQDPAHSPSRQFRTVSRLVSALSLRSHVLFWAAVNALLPWDLFFAFRLLRAKARMFRLHRAWLETWFDLEALCAVAEFADLNPHCTLPVLHPVMRDHAASFRAVSMGHPLIPEDQKVRNDFAMATGTSVAILTGSNMSGKSTFLKTIGLNLRLAFIGAPVDAVSLESGLFRVFACLQVHESVTDGVSYFYAEVRRLRALLDELKRPHELPVFFLIDEIFRGTNNRERLIGSRSYIRDLSRKPGIGLVSTHDLELVRLAEEIEPIDNFHFRDEARDGRMIFDYILRPGPCPTTNALKIMKLEGLPVED